MSVVRVQPAEEGVESEPEDENPEREIEDIAGLEEPLDSEDVASRAHRLRDRACFRDACGAAAFTQAARIQEQGGG